jgi:hypothetical protein
VQDVECRQPHGKKVPTIAEQSSPPPGTSDEPPLRGALKHSVSALKADGIPFALGGGYALWVHGGPEPSHDVDLVVAEADVELAANSLVAAGLQVERPPEDWLFKAYVAEDDATAPAESRRWSMYCIGWAAYPSPSRCLTAPRNTRSWASGYPCCRRLRS